MNSRCPNNSAERKKIILSIDSYLEIDRSTCNILNGNFNCVLDKQIDRLPSRPYDESGTKELRDLILKCNLTNIWRNQNQTIKKYALQRGKSKSRIYLTLVGCDNVTEVISCKISNCPFSDHDLNNIYLKTDDIERGPGSRIMNFNTIKSDYLK